MQNKKSLLKRMLVIYITFFVVILIGIAHNLLPDFSKGYNEGSSLGETIARSWDSGTPRSIFKLGEVTLKTPISYTIEGVNTGSEEIVQARIKHLDLTIDRPAPADANPLTLALSSIGGTPWLYLLVILGGISFIAIIVLMFIIIHSIRRSIKEERTLDGHNVWYLRIIGFLTILSELFHGIINWYTSRCAAELLANSGIQVNTGFSVSYTLIIMGILILFTAEVFAIGRNLSEEQKLTI